MEKPENPRLLAPDSTHRVWSDVTLRDLFAAAALAGFIAQGGPSVSIWDADEIHRWQATRIYAFADAMLRARAEAPDGE